MAHGQPCIACYSNGISGPQLYKSSKFWRHVLPEGRQQRLMAVPDFATSKKVSCTCGWAACSHMPTPTSELINSRCWAATMPDTCFQKGDLAELRALPAYLQAAHAWKACCSMSAAEKLNMARQKIQGKLPLYAHADKMHHEFVHLRQRLVRFLASC